MSYPDIYYTNLAILIYLSNLFFELTLFILEILNKENIYMGFLKLFIIEEIVFLYLSILLSVSLWTFLVSRTK